MLDLRQTPQYTKYMEYIGWIVERIDGVNYFIKKFPLIGSVMKIQRPEKIDFNQINKIAKQYHSFQIVIEPLNINHQSLTIKNGYKQSKSPFVPAITIHIDLTKLEKELLREMHYKTPVRVKIAYGMDAFYKIIGITYLVQDILSHPGHNPHAYGYIRYVRKLDTCL